MSTTRELLWNVPHWAEVVMYVGALLAFVLVGAGVAHRIWMYRKGQPASSLGGTFLTRVGDLVKNGILQMALAKDRLSAAIHLPLFWGFMALLVGTIILVFQIDFGLVFFYGRFYLVFSFIMDLAGLLFLLGVTLAMYRRWIMRPARFTNRWDDHYALVILWVIGATGFLIEGARIAADDFPSFEKVSFIGYPIGQILSVFAGASTWEAVHRWSWVGHMALALVFIGLVTFTKFLHTMTTPANIALRDRRPKGAMTFVPDIEEVERVGAGEVTDFAWKDLSDVDACTRCGRCEAICPAHAAGRPLSPMRVMLATREVMEKTLADSPDPDVPVPGLYDRIEDDEAWSCVTCRACAEVCPAALNQLNKILELRRYLTNEGRLAGSAAKALESMGMRGNPWQLKQADRLAWADEAGLDVPVMAILQDPDEQPAGTEAEPVDFLFYVGCAGSYDPRAQKVARAIVRLLEAAEVSYAVLGEEETCNCEAARRMGEEMLFQVGATTLKETIDQYRFKRILTMCPHCFNTLKNDYPQLGADWEVVHHTQALLELVQKGRIKVPRADATIVYHDSCYLGRYNGVYDAPRELVKALPAAKLVEMPRRKEESFCCGGGGGQMWMEIEHQDEAIEFIRTREALATGAEVICTACPFCKIMLDDGRKHLENEAVDVFDLAEVLEKGLD